MKHWDQINIILIIYDLVRICMKDPIAVKLTHEKSREYMIQNGPVIFRYTIPYNEPP